MPQGFRPQGFVSQGFTSLYAEQRPWAIVTSSTGKLESSSARTITIDLSEGVLCTVMLPPSQGLLDTDPQSFTITCIRPPKDSTHGK